MGMSATATARRDGAVVSRGRLVVHGRHKGLFKSSFSILMVARNQAEADADCKDDKQPKHFFMVCPTSALLLWFAFLASPTTVTIAWTQGACDDLFVHSNLEWREWSLTRGRLLCTRRIRPISYETGRIKDVQYVTSIGHRNLHPNSKHNSKTPQNKREKARHNI